MMMQSPTLRHPLFCSLAFFRYDKLGQSVAEIIRISEQLHFVRVPSAQLKPYSAHHDL